MSPTNGSRSKRKAALLLVVTVCSYLLLAFYIHLASLRSPYIGLQLIPGREGEGDWVIQAVEERGQAADWRLSPGDRIVSMTGVPDSERVGDGSGIAVTEAQSIVARKSDGSLHAFRSGTDAGDRAQLALSAAMELLLLGLGGYAVLAKPESRVIRKFYTLNWLLALCILAQFSKEKSLSDILLLLLSVWLPYALISFYFLFVFRTIHSRFAVLLRGCLAYSAGLSAYFAYLIGAERYVPKWAENLMNFGILGALTLLAGITVLHWRNFDPIEKRQLAKLFLAAFPCIAPYSALYAIPFLLQGDDLVPMKFTLVGLVAFSPAITYLLVARSMLHIRIPVARTLIHGVYLLAVFALFAWASRGVSAAWTCALFAACAVLTAGYRKALLRYRRKDERRTEWIDRQKRLLSLRLAERGGEGTGASEAAADAAPDPRGMLEAQQAERIRLSYYLHDHLLQNLIFLSRDLEELHETGEAEKERIALWLKCVYDSQRDIRAICDDLYPHIIDKGDLKEGLQWLIRTMKEKGDIRVELVYELEAGEPSDDWVKANLFRAVREFVNNAFKHSRATELRIRVWREGPELRCSIYDNGIGFDLDAALNASPEGERRFGLLSAYSQVRHLGGQASIRSSPGTGTAIAIHLPLGEGASAYV